MNTEEAENQKYPIWQAQLKAICNQWTPFNTLKSVIRRAMVSTQVEVSWATENEDNSWKGRLDKYTMYGGKLHEVFVRRDGTLRGAWVQSNVGVYIGREAFDTIWDACEIYVKLCESGYAESRRCDICMATPAKYCDVCGGSFCSEHMDSHEHSSPTATIELKALTGQLSEERALELKNKFLESLSLGQITVLPSDPQKGGHLYYKPFNGGDLIDLGESLLGEPRATLSHKVPGLEAHEQFYLLTMLERMGRHAT